jgi:hypothetical protein
MSDFEKYWKLRAKLHNLRYDQDHIEDEIKQVERELAELGNIY